MKRLLPKEPHLDHLKNEAKALLKAHRDGDASVCETHGRCLGSDNT